MLFDSAAAWTWRRSSMPAREAGRHLLAALDERSAGRAERRNRRGLHVRHGARGSPRRSRKDRAAVLKTLETVMPFGATSMLRRHRRSRATSRRANGTAAGARWSCSPTASTRQRAEPQQATSRHRERDRRARVHRSSVVPPVDQIRTSEGGRTEDASPRSGRWRISARWTGRRGIRRQRAGAAQPRGAADRRGAASPVSARVRDRATSRAGIRSTVQTRATRTCSVRARERDIS